MMGIARRAFVALLNMRAAPVFQRVKNHAPGGRRIYARKGERVTCEKGHVICTYARDTYCGEMQQSSRDFTNWKQREPKVGTKLPILCAICKSPWVKEFGFYHVGATWRDPLNLMKRVS